MLPAAIVDALDVAALVMARGRCFVALCLQPGSSYTSKHVVYVQYWPGTSKNLAKLLFDVNVRLLSARIATVPFS